jgi:hypothetical protein
MTYERVWYPMAVQGPRVATSAADSVAYHLWTLAQMLLGRIGTAPAGAKWSVYGSCDGTTAALDGVDRWTSTYNASLIPYQSAEANGNPHGWMVLTRQQVVNSTTYNVYLLLAANGISNGSSTGFRMAKAGLGTPTPGSTQGNPGMSVFVFNNNGPNLGATDYSTDLTNPRRYYGNMTANGDFWFAETITGEIAAGGMLYQPVGVKTNDQCPFFGFHFNTFNTQASYPFSGNSIFTRSAVAPGTYYNGATGYPAIDQPPVFALTDAADVSLFDKPGFVTVGNSTTPTAIHSRGRLADTGVCAGVIAGGGAAGQRPVNVGTTIRDGSSNVVYVTLNQLIVPYNALLS